MAVKNKNSFNYSINKLNNINYKIQSSFNKLDMTITKKNENSIFIDKTDSLIRTDLYYIISNPPIKNYLNYIENLLNIMEKIISLILQGLCIDYFVLF